MIKNNQVVSQPPIKPKRFELFPTVLVNISTM